MPNDALYYGERQHVCSMRDPWPNGHPLPQVNPDRLEGPEVGALCIINNKYKPGRVARVTAQSYVWSPGECRHAGGYRRYDWSVVTDDNGYTVVMDDKDLVIIKPGMQLTLGED